MTVHVKRTLDVLCSYYADRESTPRRINPVQAAVYGDGLARFSEVELEAAARRWMQQSKFFPALSDLLELLEPKVDMTAAAHLAWTTVEQAIRRGGLYRGARFEQGAIGEAVRQVFGTWVAACSFDADGPGWAIRRQSFLAIFPSLAARSFASVTLRGLHAGAEPYVVAALPGLPVRGGLPSREGEPLTHEESVAALQALRLRIPMLRPKAAAGERD